MAMAPGDGSGSGEKTDGSGAHAVQKAATASIAVLPFTNMSGEAEQEYFSDGITEDIITDCRRSPA